jgi:hypothetical protein
MMITMIKRHEMECLAVKPGQVSLAFGATQRTEITRKGVDPLLYPTEV